MDKIVWIFGLPGLVAFSLVAFPALGEQGAQDVPSGTDASSVISPPERIDYRQGPLAPAAHPEETDAWLNDPFMSLSLRMGEVVDKMKFRITDMPVPQQQARIVSDLDTLIELLERTCSAGAGSMSGANPTRPANDSVILGGPGGQGELFAPTDSRHEWADLPPNERRGVLQSSTEGFPPGYEVVVEDYFNRLAVERMASDDTDLAD